MTALSWSVLVIGAALTVPLFAFVVRRLIGVRVPPLRTLAAASSRCWCSRRSSRP